jgi:hypothetical protein
MIRKYFSLSFVVTGLGLILAALVGWVYTGSVRGSFEAFVVAAILALLEISLSFDNAIVNAVVLREMNAKWRRRFMTWGMLIAVFGMRLLFPLLIVVIVAHVGPWEALRMATLAPDDYARLMLGAHLQISAFGGSFLMMVALKYFYDKNKQEHWIPWLEKPAVLLGRVQSIEIAVTLIFLIGITRNILPEHQLSYLLAGLAGVVTFVFVDGLSGWLESAGGPTKNAQRASAGLFLYLEVLDASFSFDGVVGAFAITHNLFIIMIGLSIGAFFVRSLTVMFVEQQTLARFLFLEHGAFYAIGALSMIMLFDPLWHIPDWFTGLIGAGIILSSLFWSVRVNPKGLSGPMKS